MSTMNRLGNVNNIYQNYTQHKRVLCVCSAGLLRSPTAAYVLSMPPFNYNTRSAGANDEYALVPVDGVLLSWADEIVFMENHHLDMVSRKWEFTAPAIVLNIPDHFRYRDPELIEMITHNYQKRLADLRTFEKLSKES